jgi:ankyrin repeat protein
VDAQRCRAGSTPLMLAAQQLQTCGPHIASLLLAHARIDVSVADVHLGKTALHHAAEFGGADLVKACIAVEPELLNARDGMEASALMLAAANGHAGIVELLLQQGGVEANARDLYGALRVQLWRPLRAAATSGALRTHHMMPIWLVSCA